MDFHSLIWQEPWLTPVILNLRNIIETEAVPTAAVTPDGKTLYYNPLFWKGLTQKEKIGVQIHELLHIVNLHSQRRENRIFEKWNIACDKAINYQITSSGYKLPKYALSGENDTAENIYKKLPDIQGQTDGKILADDLLKRNKDGSDDFADTETREAVDAASQLAGSGATPLSRQFKPILSRSDWRIILQNLVKSVLGDEYDYLSYEIDEFGICEDILCPKPHAKLCVLVDESGSIDDALYRQFLGELEKMKRFADIYVSGFTDNTELNAVPLKDYHRTMTGGTDVRRPYEQACQMQFDCIIVLTDGCLAFPKHEPTDTIWVMPKSFGRRKEVIL